MICYDQISSNGLPVSLTLTICQTITVITQLIIHHEHN